MPIGRSLVYHHDSEVVGKKFQPARSRVHSRGPQQATHGPGSHTGEYIYYDRAPRGLETQKLAATRLLICNLATARILCFSHPPPLGLAQRPHCHQDIAVATIPSDKGSDITPTPPPVERRTKRDSEGRNGWTWVLVFLYLCTLWVFSFYFILTTILIYLGGFGKLVGRCWQHRKE